jgi:hypothetical protein
MEKGEGSSQNQPIESPNEPQEKGIPYHKLFRDPRCEAWHDTKFALMEILYGKPVILKDSENIKLLLERQGLLDFMTFDTVLSVYPSLVRIETKRTTSLF